MTRYFEELAVGETVAFGRYEMPREEIVAFARQYDPQPFHLDDDAAAAGLFGGLVASGWHVGAATMRLLVDGYLHGLAVLGSPGLEELRWTAPVRPGDVLSIRVTLEATRPLERHADRGLAHLDVETLNADDEVVMRMTASMLVERRPPADA